jgi:hypothetical protein
MEIIAITICVNYADFLKYTLLQNYNFFKKWYIITSPDDINTINTIKVFNISNVECLIYNDFYTNSKFNKGGAVKFGQEHVNNHHYDSNILLLDADIYLPDNLLESLPEKIENNTLYGVANRFDYWTKEDFLNRENPHLYQYTKYFAGFFQLYKQGHPNTYLDSYNCSRCDNNWVDTFESKHALDIDVIHLGRDMINWDGRDYDNCNSF